MPVRPKFDKSVPDVIDALKQCYGIVTHAADKLGICKFTLYNFINAHPEIKPELDKIRQHSDFEFLDLAEHVLRRNLLRVEENPRNALDAAKLVFDRKGRQRGWNMAIEDKEQFTEEAIHLSSALMSQISDLQSSLKNNKNSVNNE